MVLTAWPCRPARTASYALFAMLSACGSGGGGQHAAAGAATTTLSFTAMSEADIRRRAIGCLQPPPYPIDGGPTCLRQDGSWIAYSGWGNPQGRYRVTGNAVTLGPSFSSDTTIVFYRDRRGAMFIRYDDRDLLRPFTPFPEADYHRWIGPPPPPPG